VSPVLCEMGDLVEKAPVHHDKVGAHLVERSDIVGEIREPEHQPCSASSKTRLYGFLDELEYFGKVEASIKVL